MSISRTKNVFEKFTLHSKVRPSRSTATTRLERVYGMLSKMKVWTNEIRLENPPSAWKVLQSRRRNV